MRYKQTSLSVFEEKFEGNKDKVLISNFSGGRTSGYLTHRLLQQKDQWKEIIVIFANTGCEHEKTLEFIKNCDDRFNFQTHWIEADINIHKGKGTKAKIVDFKTASRDGKPFESYISKYSIPCTISPSCSRELKEYPIKSYIRDNLGLKKQDYVHAIGIRSDEQKRVSKSAAEHNLIYPLLNWNIDKDDVLDWWESQNFDLEIPEHLGNCVWCWKKSFKKLMTIMVEEPESFDFPKKMETKYPRAGAVAKAINKDMKFFRGFKSVQDLKDMSSQGFEKFIDLHHLHITDGCSESCEPFHGETESNLINVINLKEK